MTFSEFLTDTKAVRERGEYFVQLYPKNASGVETQLNFSRRGTATPPGTITVGSDTLAGNTPYDKRLISAPVLTQSIWQSGKILSRSLPSYGSIQLDNRNGGLDIYHPSQGYTFTDCRYKVFFADKSDISNTIGKIADGYMSSVEFSFETMTINTKGKESLFEQQVSSRVYRGTGYMLELSGARKSDYGTPAAVNLTGNMTVVLGWIWIDTTPGANIAPVYGWTLSGWRINLTTARQLSFRQAVAGVTQGPTTTATLNVQTPYHVAVVVSGLNVTFYIWNDDTQTLTTETFTSTFTATPRDVASGTLVHNSASALVIWLDESRVFNYSQTPAEIEADRFRELTTIPATCVHYVKFNDGAGATVTDSSATAANGTISGAGTSTWLWSNEGGPELAGTPKPDAWGERWGVAPVLVDPVRQGYQVAGGGAIQDVTTYEGGLSHTMDASSASYRAYLTTTPAAGHSLRYLPRGLFKLGSQPLFPVSALVKGYNGGSLGYVSTGGNIVRDIVTRRGPKLVDPTDLDTALFTSYESANTAICGLAIHDKQSIGDTLDSIMASARGWWGYGRSNTLFGIYTFTGPTGATNYTFTEKNIVSISPAQPLGIVFQVVVLYRQNDVVLNEGQMAASVKSTLNWQQWTLNWQREEATDESLRSATAISLEVKTALQYRADAKTLADALLSLLKGQKYGWSVVVTATGLQAVIDEICTISVTLQNETVRLGLDGTKKYSIVTAQDRRQSGTVQLDIWG